jgi:hypothetical protein
MLPCSRLPVLLQCTRCALERNLRRRFVVASSVTELLASCRHLAGHRAMKLRANKRELMSAPRCSRPGSVVACSKETHLIVCNLFLGR